MPDHIVPLERFHEARRVLDGRIDRTPILSSSTAARVLAARGVRVADGRIYAKAENLQKTGAAWMGSPSSTTPRSLPVSASPWSG
jgi:threonine dehydratase